MRPVIFLAILPLSAFAEIWTCPSPGKEITSAKYELAVYQNDESQPSFTYQDKNSDAKLAKRMTDFNHFTTFSFEGPVQVKVRLLDASANGPPAFSPPPVRPFALSTVFTPKAISC